MIRVGIADDHQLFRKSLRLVLESFSNIKVVFDLHNGKKVVEKMADGEIDVLLLDIQMPEMDGYETCKIIRAQYPDVKVLIVSQLTSRESIHKVMESGAHGFFSKDTDPDALETAINSITDKDFYFGTDLGNVVREAILWDEQHARPALIQAPSLTDREIQVVRLACRELSSFEIADRMNINVRTVETHRKRIMEKTDCKNFIGVIILSLRNGWIKMEEL